MPTTTPWAWRWRGVYGTVPGAAATAEYGYGIGDNYASGLTAVADAGGQAIFWTAVAGGGIVAGLELFGGAFIAETAADEAVSAATGIDIPISPVDLAQSGIVFITRKIGRTVDFVAGVEARSFGKVVGEGTVHVRPTIDAIENGSLLPRTAYKNKENHPELLGRPTGYWQEYHLLEFGGKSPLRVLRGGQGEYFLSPDHYITIIPLNIR